MDGFIYIYIGAGAIILMLWLLMRRDEKHGR